MTAQGAAIIAITAGLVGLYAGAWLEIRNGGK